MTKLGKVLENIVHVEDAKGAVMLLLRPERVEIVAALPEDEDLSALAAKIRVIADEIESGSGMPVQEARS